MSLDNFQRMRCYPDVELGKASFQSLLEGDEKLPAFRQVGDVDEEADEVVPVRLSFVAPDAADVLRLTRNSAQLRSSFRMVSASNSSGTELPSLNRSGSRTS